MWRLLLIGLATAALFAPAPGDAGSPAQAELAFARAGSIWVAGADGTGARRLRGGYAPDWSPDGRRIAFVARRGTNEDVYVMDADGRNVRRLTRAPGHDLSPAWSPDGRRIAFSRDAEIWTMRADGRDQRRLVRKAKIWHEHYSPAWSGATIVYSSTRAGAFNAELYAVPARRLTFTRGSDGVLGDDGTPAFSPDGRRIAFASNRTQEGEIWVMNRDGSGQRRLLRHPGDDFLPSWSPDGQTIAFSAPASGWVFSVGVDGTGLRRLARGEDPDYRPRLLARLRTPTQTSVLFPTRMNSPSPRVGRGGAETR